MTDDGGLVEAAYRGVDQRTVAVLVGHVVVDVAFDVCAATNRHPLTTAHEIVDLFRRILGRDGLPSHDNPALVSGKRHQVEVHARQPGAPAPTAAGAMKICG
jgi:hypothetical protein